MPSAPCQSTTVTPLGPHLNALPRPAPAPQPLWLILVYAVPPLAAALAACMKWAAPSERSSPWELICLQGLARLHLRCERRKASFNFPTRDMQMEALHHSLGLKRLLSASSCPGFPRCLLGACPLPLELGQFLVWGRAPRWGTAPSSGVTSRVPRGCTETRVLFIYISRWSVTLLSPFHGQGQR